MSEYDSGTWDGQEIEAKKAWEETGRNKYGSARNIGGLACLKFKCLNRDKKCRECFRFSELDEGSEV